MLWWVMEVLPVREEQRVGGSRDEKEEKRWVAVCRRFFFNVAIFFNGGAL